jgi:hypothetical protein
MSDVWLFIIDVVAILATVGTLVGFALFSGGLRTRARDVLGTTLMLGIILEGTFVVILGEHFLEQFKSH